MPVDMPGRRVRPITREISTRIISGAAERDVSRIAPDIPEPIDPGRPLGVAAAPDSSDDHVPVWGVNPAMVTRLQSVRGYPCISLLMTTKRGPRMTPADAARLERLRLNALRRLREEKLTGSGQALVADLDRLVQEAVSGPTERAVALYVSKDLAQTVTLPVEVEDRAVVDPTFATRDLVRALHRTPRHVVVVLSAHRAALFDGSGGRLTPVAGSHFPMNLQTTTGAPTGAHRASERGGGAAALRQVDRGLGSYLRLHPAPVVVVGPQKVVAAFRSISRNLARLAGTVYGGFEHSGTEELAERTRPVLERYLSSREQEALALLDRRTGAHRVASGMASAWLAARTERPEMLVVEEGFWYPARLSTDGDLATPATDVEAPDVIDDLVDELIETVLDRGGWVALVRDGSLSTHERVALTLR